MDLKALAERYLDENHVMQVATVVGGQPWICTVYYVYDKGFNFYWASLPTRRHSVEIAKNPQVAAAIKVKGVIGEKVIGFQIEGQASIIDPSLTDRSIVEKYAARFGRDEQWVEDFVNGNTEHRLYKLTPAAITLFDEEDFPETPQQKLL